MIWKNMFRRKARTFLTIGGIAIAIAVVIFLSIFADGLSSQMSTLMSSEGAKITLMQSGIADISFSAIDEEIGKAISGFPEVKQISGLLLQLVPVEEKPFMLILGINPDEAYIDHFRIIAGENTIAHGDLILGRMAADFFSKGPGDILTIQEHQMRISGIFETGTGFEDAGAVISLAIAQDIFMKHDQVSLYRINVEDIEDEQLEVLKQEMAEQYPQVSAYLSSDFGRNTPDIQTLDTVSSAISLIGLIAGALGTTNTMVMNVFERTREIGTFRAIGWRRRRVMGMVVGEAVVMSLFGGIVGILMGFGLALMMSQLPVFAGYFALKVSIETLISGIILAVMLGILGSIIPAWWASRLSPMEALKYE